MSAHAVFAVSEDDALGGFVYGVLGVGAKQLGVAYEPESSSGVDGSALGFEIALFAIILHGIAVAANPGGGRVNIQRRSALPPVACEGDDSSGSGPVCVYHFQRIVCQCGAPSSHGIVYGEGVD